MKKMIIGILFMLAFYGNIQASPLSDFIIGAVLMVNGGIFEGLRAQAASDRDDANQKEVAQLNGWQADLVTANYFKGAADWELIKSGNTVAYQSFYNNFTFYFSRSQVELSSASGFSGTASDDNNKENLYKGVSLTSFGIGSFFIIKSAFTYLYRRSHTQTAQKAKGYEWVMAPASGMNGASVLLKVRL